MENKNNNKNILIIVIVAIVLIVSVLMLIFSQKKDIIDNNGNKITENGGYKTKDKRFTLSIVERNDLEAYNNAKRRYDENTFDEIIKPNVRFYAYLNNRVFVIDDVIEDDNYALYSFVGLPTEEYGHRILVNKQNKTIEVSDEDLAKVDNSCFNNGFCGFQEQVNFIKSNTGYFFVNNNHGLVTIYTSNWQKLGYVDKANNIQLDADGGVYVYDNVKQVSCNGDYCEYKSIGTPVKYNVDGSK